MSGVEEPKKDDLGTSGASSGKSDVKKSTQSFNGVTAEDLEEATWGEVCTTCCCHTPMEWVQILIVIVLVCFFLFFFILGLEILGDGAQVMTGCAAGGLFSDDMNPIAALMVGVLCTVCMQSSSTTTSIIVSLVGAEAIGVQTAIYVSEVCREESVNKLEQRQTDSLTIHFFFYNLIYNLTQQI